MPRKFKKDRSQSKVYADIRREKALDKLRRELIKPKNGEQPTQQIRIKKRPRTKK